jgi:hypothetical protein
MKQGEHWRLLTRGSLTMGRFDERNVPGDEFGSMYANRGRFPEQRDFGASPYEAGHEAEGGREHPGHRDFGGNHAYDGRHPGHRHFGRDENPSARGAEGRRWTASGYPGGHRGVGPQGYARSDERIREDVCERLTLHDAIDASRIEVNVADGVVTLGGDVPERYMKHLAEDAVVDTIGVKDVENALRVRSGDRTDT